MTVMTESSSSVGQGGRRLFLGNLFPDVKSEDIQKLLSKHASVRGCDIKARKDIDGNVVSTFAFVEVDFKDPERGLPECIRNLNGLRWKQHQIKVQAAQESFLQRLARERREKIANFNTDPDPNYDPVQILKQRNDSMKKNSNQESDSGSGKKSLPFGTFGSLHGSQTSKSKSVKSGQEGPLPIIDFNDDKEDVPTKRLAHKRVMYHSSSEDEDKPIEPPQKMIKKQSKTPISQERKQNTESSVRRARYHSSSSSDEDEGKRNVGSHQSSDKFLAKLEQFNKGVWKSSDDEDEDVVMATSSSRKIDSVDANRKRLQALKERKKNEMMKSDVVKDALAKLDKSQSKKIKFEEEIKGEVEKPNLNEKETKVVNQLFDDDDSGGTSDGDEELKIREEFEGKKGQKLMRLESRYAQDERFKLDSRFKDDDTDDEKESSNDDGGEDEESNDKTLEAERDMNFKVLQEIIGDKVGVVQKKKEAPKVPFKDVSSLRFDPEAEQDQSFKKNKLKGKAEEETEPTKLKNDAKQDLTISNEKVSWVKKEAFLKSSSDEVKETSGFRFGFGSGASNDQGNQSFSLLKKIGSDQYASEDIKSSKKKKKLDFLERNPFKYDSSSSDDEENCDDDLKNNTEEAVTNEFTRKLAAKTSSLSEEFFFQGPDDARFKEAQDFLASGKNLDELRSKLEEERPKLSSILKKKVRNKVKLMQNKKGSRWIRGKKMMKWKNGKRISKKNKMKMMNGEQE